MSSFQINDIILDIPPKNIRIDRRSFNHKWQTLRTRSSVKSKSGYSTLDIYVTAEFTDNPSPGNKIGDLTNGLSKLRNIISQIRVTPFCFIENQFLRKSILGSNNIQNMAIAVKQIEIVKDNQDTNVITVNFHFCWFNYFPFTRDFAFKSHIWEPKPVFNPADSKAWKMLYHAEQRRAFRTSDFGYRDVGSLQTGLTARFKQFGSITIRKYEQLEKEIEIIKSIRSNLASLMTGAEGKENQDIKGIRDMLSKEVADKRWAETNVRELVGDMTSMLDDMPATQVLSKFRNVLTNQLSSSKYEYMTEWTVVQINGSAVSFKGSPSLQKNPDGKDKYDKEDTILLSRGVSLDFNDTGLVIQSISISFENILAMLPLMGHPFPSFQHIGSIDAEVVISFATTMESAIEKLSSFYSAVEDQSLKYRNIPAGHRNIKIENDIVNMCGLEGFLAESFVVENIEGEPGSYQGALVLVDNPLTEYTRENFQASGSFTSGQDLRSKIAEIIEKNIKFYPDKLYEIQGATEHFFLGLNYKTTHEKIEIQESGKQAFGVALSPLKYYEYSGPENNGRNARFAKLCSEYAENLANFVKKLVLNLGNLIGPWNNSVLAKEIVADLLLLKNKDLISIERVNEDLTEIYNSIRRAKGQGYINTFRSDFYGKSYVSEHNLGDTQVKSEKIIDAYNQGQEEQALLGSIGMGQFRDTSVEDIVEGIGTEDNIRLNALINNSFQEWAVFTQKFLDKILNTKSLRDLPQFKEVRESMNKTGLSAGADNYPDFPIRDVLSTLQASSDDLSKNAYNKLNGLYEESGLALKNVGIAAFIDPDFYFFEPQNDVVDNLIPIEAMNDAKDAIIEAKETQEQVEGDWFKNVYEKDILGLEKSSLLTGMFSRENKDLIERQSKADEKDGEADNGAVDDYISKKDSSFKDNAMAPNQLVGSLGCASYEAEKPIELVSIQPGDGDNQDNNLNTNYRNSIESNVSPPSNAAAVQHRFETNEVLSFLPPSEYENPADHDSGKDPSFKWPTRSTVRRITSRYGKRDDPVAKKQGEKKPSFHKGLDLAADNWRDSRGSEILASASGRIIKISDYGKVIFHPTLEIAQQARADAKGVTLVIQHANGWITKYSHLMWDEITQGWASILYRSADLGISDDGVNRALTVEVGKLIGHMGTTGYSTGPHLHFQMEKDGQHTDPLPILKGETTKSQGPIAGLDPNNESLFTKSIEQFEKELKSGQGYGMKRAYPTFKLYFIESDLGERKKFAFDDFFSYSAIQEIEVIRSRKIAADLCRIRMTNISGVLSNRKFSFAADPTKNLDEEGNIAVEKGGSATNTAKENPIASLMLQPGIQVQLNLGYSNNPDELDVVFNGVITDVQFSESTDLVEIVCQSFAIELIQSIHGEVKEFGGWFDGDGRTFAMLEQLLASPEVVHFGRWEGGEFGKNAGYSLLKNRWKFQPSPQDDNIFAPQGSNVLGLMDRFLGNFSTTPTYSLYHTTVWDVFQEMTLRHPSYIACPVPYQGKHGPRMTMFFGLPDQLYFARDPDHSEEDVMEQMRKIVKDGVEGEEQQRAQERMVGNDSLPSEELENAVTTNDKKEQEAWVKKIAKIYALDKGFIKPFRSYHVLTSSMHILHNSISSSAHNTFNTVTLQYSDDSPYVDNDTARLNFDDAKAFTLKADAAIPDEEVRELFAQYPNCVGYEMAKNYCVSLLFNSLKEAYTGSIVSVGNPKIRPFDVVYIFDEYNDMYGPIEVEQVIHRFSQKNGFITEITPDLMVHVNQHSTMATADAMGLIVEQGLKSIGLQSLGSIVKASVGVGSIDTVGAAVTQGVLAPLSAPFAPIARMFFNSSENAIGVKGASSITGMLGIFIFRKLITRTQLAHPFRFSPLVLGNKPMIGGLPNRHTGGSFIQRIGKWIKEAERTAPLYLNDVYDKLHPNSWAGHTQGDISNYLLGDIISPPE